MEEVGQDLGYDKSIFPELNPLVNEELKGLHHVAPGHDASISGEGRRSGCRHPRSSEFSHEIAGLGLPTDWAVANVSWSFPSLLVPLRGPSDFPGHGHAMSGGW